MMASKSSTTILDLGLVLCLLSLLLQAGFGGSDLAQDRAECADKLVGLTGCLSYVSGQAKAPTLDCCNGFKDVLHKSNKCICLLIKDRNDPNLGLKINATLAVKLPSICHAPTNITKCIDFLHLASNSKEAKEFEDLAKLAGKDGSTPAASSTELCMSIHTPRRPSSSMVLPISLAQKPTHARDKFEINKFQGSNATIGTASRSGGGWDKRWTMVNFALWIIPLLFITHMFFLV